MSDVGRWDQRYREGDTPWDTGQPSSELLRVVAAEGIKPCRAVELGCGTGTNSLWLASRGFDVVGVDISEVVIERARARAAGEPRARFVVADVLTPLDLGEPFPFFFDRGCYHVVRRDDVAAYLRTLGRITTADAVGLVLAGNAREKHEPGPPVVSEEELRAELGRVFSIAWLREIRFDAAPGIPVRFLGWSCLVRKHAG
jgi:SAM-dependent methyltransferase